MAKTRHSVRMFTLKMARKRPKRDRIGITATGLGLEQDPCTQRESLAVTWKAGSFNDLQPKLANPISLITLLISTLQNKAVQREMDLVAVSGSVGQLAQPDAIINDT